MCDYSLAGLKNRLIRQDENVVLKSFGTGTKGFAPVPTGVCIGPQSSITGKPTLWERISGWFDFTRLSPGPKVEVVCIMPGAKLLATGGPYDGIEVEFGQFHCEANRHRDGLIFPDGYQMSLQDERLTVGMRFTCVSLGDEERYVFVPEKHMVGASR